MAGGCLFLEIALCLWGGGKGLEGFSLSFTDQVFSECLLYVLLISMVVGFLFNLLNSMAGGVFLCWFDHKFVLQQLF